MLLKRDVVRDGFSQWLPARGFTVVSQRKIDARGERPPELRDAAKDGLGFAHLILREAGRDRTQIRGELEGLDFEAGLFRGGLFLGLEVAADADPVELAVDPPGEDAVSIFEPANAE